MASKSWDSDYYAKKRNNISEIIISLKTPFTALGFVKGKLTFVSSTLILSFIIIYMTVHNYWHDRLSN